jgi:hypothetical protein
MSITLAAGVLLAACGGRSEIETLALGAGGKSGKSGGASSGGRSSGGAGAIDGAGGTRVGLGGTHSGGVESGDGGTPGAGGAMENPGSGGGPSAGCAPGEFDNPSTDALDCSLWTTCVPGEFIFTQGTATSDRACKPCGVGQFSENANQTECAPHGYCELTELETPGTATHDVSCSSAAGFGLLEPSLRIHDIAADGNNVFAVGEHRLAEDFQAVDSFLYVFDSNGGALRSGDLITATTVSTADRATAVWARGDGTMLIVGEHWLEGSTSELPLSDGYLAYVSEYGEVLSWLSFGSTDRDIPFDVAVAADGTIYVVGQGSGSSPQTQRSLLWIFDAQGLQAERVIDEDEGERLTKVRLDPGGSVYVAGLDHGDGISVLGSDGIWMRDIPYPAAGLELSPTGGIFRTDAAGYVWGMSPSEQNVWAVNANSPQLADSADLALDPSGILYHLGTVERTIPGPKHVFVSQVDSDGTLLESTVYAPQVSIPTTMTGPDQAVAIAIDPAGRVFVTGTTTLRDQTIVSFIMRVDEMDL